MHPYREHTRARRENEGVKALARARWATLLSAIPLATIGVAFFLPIEGWTGPSAMVQHSIDVEDVVAILFIWPPYLVAALLVTILAITARRLDKHRPGDKNRRLGPIPSAGSRAIASWAVACSFLGAPALVALLFHSPPQDPRVTALLVFSLVFSAALGAVFFSRTRRTRGWRRWGFLLATYTASTCPLSALHVFIAVNRERLGTGLVFYGLATVMLWALAIIAIWPARRRAAAGEPRGPARP